MRTNVIGIDPGLTGGIALYECLSRYVTTVKDVPTMGTAKNRTIDAAALIAQMEAWSYVETRVLIERVGAMPGQGVSSTFRFGESYGAIQACIAALRLPVRYVTPAKWKKHYRIGRDKEDARKKATELMPIAAHQWARKMDHGRAEAALIALYGAENWSQL